MDIDNMILELEGELVTIYPLAEIEQDTKHFIIYMRVLTKELSRSDMYVGEVINENELIPVKENLLPYFEQFMEKLMKAYQ